MARKKAVLEVEVEAVETVAPEAVESVLIEAGKRFSLYQVGERYEIRKGGQLIGTESDRSAAVKLFKELGR